MRVTIIVLLTAILGGASAKIQAQAFLEQGPQTGTVDGVLIEDVDDFTEWAFKYAGLDYDEDNEFTIRTSPLENEYVEGNFVDGQVTLLDEDDVIESDNPAMARLLSFIDVSPAQNPFDRDVDELPSDPDDKGKDHRKGNTQFLLITTFDSDTEGSGEVWVVPRDDTSKSFVLVGGLQTPTGVCFDRNHEFLYVCDPAQGSIFQYEIEWSGNDKFILDNDQVATIFQGGAPSACSVDAYSNLYFTDLATNTIRMVDYLDLWSGFVNQDVALFTRDESNPAISVPVGIDVYSSDTVFWVNNQDTQNSGLIGSGPADTNDIDIASVTLRDEMNGLALTVSDNYIYFSNTDGSVSVM